jgi:hypothetical protein
MTGAEAKAIVRDAARAGKVVSAWKNKNGWGVSTRLGPWNESRLMTDVDDARRVLGL